MALALRLLYVPTTHVVPEIVALEPCCEMPGGKLPVKVHVTAPEAPL
jgi:hypothetical protein